MDFTESKYSFSQFISLPKQTSEELKNIDKISNQVDILEKFVDHMKLKELDSKNMDHYVYYYQESTNTIFYFDLLKSDSMTPVSKDVDSKLRVLNNLPAGNETQ